MAETRTFYPPPSGEYRTNILKEKPSPVGYTSIIYAVHPSSVGGGDRNKVAQKGIQTQLDRVGAGTRVVLIAPPEKCVYLDPATQVTDIRSDASHYRWVARGLFPDITPHVNSITLIGGNIEHCLGAVYEEVISGLRHESQAEMSVDRKIQVNLPLDAIYTTDGITARDELTYLANKTNPLEAVTALLITTDLDRENYRNYNIISPYGDINYEIELNNERIGILKPHQRVLPKFTPPLADSSLIQWPEKPEPREITVKLNLTEYTPSEHSIDSNITDLLDRKILLARDKVLPSYNII